MKHFKPKEVVQVVKINVDCASIFFVVVVVKYSTQKCILQWKISNMHADAFFFFSYIFTLIRIL